ncbi:capsular polysaccharide biosynthesis protein [Wandonia haliotis]|uniref:protein-tyrosine-phosphatase n=1 Tax=Wandonia haliotis TaxID=574963 RepID=A0ABP3Y6Q6_9FLAO
MALFDWLKGKSRRVADLGKLGVDVHSHLIPGIDDGSRTMDESLGMIQKFHSLGYRKLITTPHVMTDFYKNTPEIITSGMEKVKSEIMKYEIPIELEAAAEYYFDEQLIPKIEKGEILVFGDKYVLFEFSFNQEPQNIEALLFTFQKHGYHPVLAHYERYGYYDTVRKAEELRERGVKIQMNLNSLTGHYGPKVRKQAEHLVNQKLIDFVGSDCHRIEHLNLLENNLEKSYFHKVLDLDLINYTL